MDINNNKSHNKFQQVKTCYWRLGHILRYSLIIIWCLRHCYLKLYFSQQEWVPLLGQYYAIVSNFKIVMYKSLLIFSDCSQGYKIDINIIRIPQICHQIVGYSPRNKTDVIIIVKFVHLFLLNFNIISCCPHKLLSYVQSQVMSLQYCTCNCFICYIYTIYFIGNQAYSCLMVLRI